ncbi:MAG: hypothetical protein HQK51_06495 [Oligoflexia bacterium]|nr:hypothetical protein [Oligoflexia bacterium]
MNKIKFIKIFLFSLFIIKIPYALTVAIADTSPSASTAEMMATPATPQVEEKPTPGRLKKFISALSFSAGNLTPYANDVQINHGGKKNSFTWNPFVKFALNLNLGASGNPDNKWSFIPSYAMVYPSHNGDTHTKQFMSFASFPIGYFATSNLQFRVGPGLFFYNVSGDGELEELRNGSSQSTFYVPRYSKVSVNAMMDWSIGYRILSFLSVDFEMFFISPQKDISRQSNYAFLITYYFNHLLVDKK